MKDLIALEARRFSSRRVTRALAGLVVLGFLVAGPIVFARSTRDATKATAAARADAVRGYEECVAARGVPDGEPCEQPRLDEITVDPRFHLTDLVPVSGGVGALLIILGLVAGSSFVGADWHHRVIGTMLTWEPRRARVVVAKAAAAAVVTFAAAVVLLSFLGVVLTPAAVWRGTTGGADAAWFGELAGTILRGAAAAGAAAAIGSAIAMIGRATAVAIGALFAWTAVAENSIRSGIPGWRRWLVSDTTGAFVSGGGPEFVRGTVSAGLLLALYTTLAVVVAVRAFDRSDVA